MQPPGTTEEGRESFVSLDAGQATTLAAVVDRMFPPDEACPGATALGVVSYIDRQLATAWGRGERMYTQEPYRVAEDGAHGWQSRLSPAGAYACGLAALRRHARERFGIDFAAASASEQDELIAAMERGELAGFEDISSAQFFDLLHANVQEGLFGDPRHGGNRDLLGWRWIGLPGRPL